VHGDRCEAHECAKACALSVVIQALEFEPVGPQNQWVVLWAFVEQFIFGYQDFQSWPDLSPSFGKDAPFI
jgi:hypothetical protein